MTATTKPRNLRADHARAPAEDKPMVAAGRSNFGKTISGEKTNEICDGRKTSWKLTARGTRSLFTL
jgi:hypothetical protein